MTSTMTAFLVCQLLVVLFIALHDWVPLGRFSNLEGVRGSDSTTKLVMVTALSTLPFAIGLVASFQHANTRAPFWLGWFLWITYGVGLYGMLRAWYLPYLFGNEPMRIERYKKRFANTHAFLPLRHGIRPDTLHVGFHAVYAATVVLLAVLTFRDHVYAL